MPATRLMPTEEGQDLIDLTREICAKELRPRVDEAERRAATTPELPRDAFRTLGRAGLLSLPYPEEFGGGGQPYEVYLQVVEEIASAWMSIAVGVSVHSLTCYPVAQFGTTQAQREALLPAMLSGDQLGAYCLSERNSGSDVASMSARATPTTRRTPRLHAQGHQGVDQPRGPRRLLHLFVRTSDDGGRGLSCFVVPGDAAGLGVRRAREEDGAALRHGE